MTNEPMRYEKQNQWQMKQCVAYINLLCAMISKADGKWTDVSWKAKSMTNEPISYEKQKQRKLN